MLGQEVSGCFMLDTVKSY